MNEHLKELYTTASRKILNAMYDGGDFELAEALLQLMDLLFVKDAFSAIPDFAEIGAKLVKLRHVENDPTVVDDENYFGTEEHRRMLRRMNTALNEGASADILSQVLFILRRLLGSNKKQETDQFISMMCHVAKEYPDLKEFAVLDPI